MVVLDGRSTMFALEPAHTRNTAVREMCIAPAARMEIPTPPIVVAESSPCFWR